MHRFITLQARNISGIDIGTGGGLPGIPLAILFPEVKFTLVDSIAKKIRVVDAIVAEAGLNNVTCIYRPGREHEGEI